MTRRLGAASLALALATFGCSRDPDRGVRPIPEPVELAGGTASPRPPPSSSAPPRTYGPALLQAQTCPSQAPSMPPLVDRGCEACGPGEFCKALFVRGDRVGVCAKSTCQKDADCPGGLCACGPPNECVHGNCRSPADCGGRECAPNRGQHGHGLGSFCRTKDDACASHADCGPGEECAFVGRRWGCLPEVPPPPPG